MANPHDEAGEGYHPSNLPLQPYPHDAVIELARRGRELGVQFQIGGIPFGANYNRALWDAFIGAERESSDSAITQDPASPD